VTVAFAVVVIGAVVVWQVRRRRADNRLDRVVEHPEET
jgi:hypothetical protein